MSYAEQMNSPEWRWIAAAVKQRDGWKCRECGKTSRDSILDAHHTCYLKGGPCAKWSSQNDDMRTITEDMESMGEAFNKWEEIRSKYGPFETLAERYGERRAIEITQDAWMSFEYPHIITLCRECHYERQDLENCLRQLMTMAFQRYPINSVESLLHHLMDFNFRKMRSPLWDVLSKPTYLSEAEGEI